MEERTSALSASTDHGMVKRGGASTIMQSTIAPTTTVFCNLCKYRAGTPAQMELHVTKHSQHKKKLNANPGCDDPIVRRGGADKIISSFVALDTETSPHIWVKRESPEQDTNSTAETKEAGKARSKRRTPTSTITRPELPTQNQDSDPPTQEKQNQNSEPPTQEMPFLPKILTLQEFLAQAGKTPGDLLREMKAQCELEVLSSNIASQVLEEKHSQVEKISPLKPQERRSRSQSPRLMTDSDDSSSSSSFSSSSSSVCSSKHSPPPSPSKIQVKLPKPIQDSWKRKLSQSEDAPPSKLVQ